MSDTKLDDRTERLIEDVANDGEGPRHTKSKDALRDQIRDLTEGARMRARCEYATLFTNLAVDDDDFQTTRGF